MNMSAEKGGDKDIPDDMQDAKEGTEESGPDTPEAAGVPSAGFAAARLFADLDIKASLTELMTEPASVQSLTFTPPATGMSKREPSSYAMR